MFENVLYQNATKLLMEDVRHSSLPQSILFAGPASSGKLTCALELARGLSCRHEQKGLWECTCPSCLKQKALSDQNVLIAGPSSRTLEIRAAKDTLLSAFLNNSSYLPAARYLYVRAVRKLTLRFKEVLWEGDDKLSKFSPLLQSIDECLEELNPLKKLPEDEGELVKLLESIQKDAEKLESSYLYDSLPVAHVRRISTWAHLTSTALIKVVIIENADRMQESARNALLKTLEEPPAGTLFILLTQNRSAILPTILSRVRTYTFSSRTPDQEKEVIRRVFHNSGQYSNRSDSSINAFLQSFLDADLDTVKKCAFDFFESVANGHVPDIKKICSYCSDFNPSELFRIFLENLIDAQKKLCSTAKGSQCSAGILQEIRRSWNNFSTYNQTAQGALERLARNMMQINHVNEGAFRTALSREEE